MSRVFISYRHTPPDEALADKLEAFLNREGLEVFLDKRMQVGTDWVAEIDRRLRAASAFVVLLSADSILSDMLRQEVKLAHQLSSDGELRIFPIRIDFEGGLPYDLGAYLNRLQYASWKLGEDVGLLCHQLLAAIRGTAALPSWGGDAAALAASAPIADGALAAGAPLPAADGPIAMDTGTMRLDSPFYIERAEDRLLAEGLEHRGVTFRVKGVRQCGKSSLVARAYALARRAGRSAAYVDFQSLDEAHFASLQTLLQALARRISRALGIRSSPERFWHDGAGDKESFAAFLEEEVLAAADSPVILCLDEVDRVFPRPYRDDFFSGLRNWHNQRATEPAWECLNMVIAHATEPSLWIQNPEQSPFNVGDKLDLDDFSSDQVAELGRRYRRPLAATPDLKRLMDLLGGHPYLVRQALYVLGKNGWAFADLERVACDDGGPFGDHLRRQLWGLRQEPRLRPAVQEVLRRGACGDEDSYQRLRAAGLVRGEDRAALRLRCRLYHEYLTRHL